ncbi:hypothetical protein MPSEU_000848600 [Mayamaea pseudoterrestris]|nr:hypothetical protein MPSEU_000848600 [Mayamaea pseudoterrestris]
MSMRRYFQISVIDVRSLAAFRILLGLLLLYDTYTRFSLGRFDLYWYTQDGYLGQSELPHQAPLHKLWFYRGNIEFQIVCVGLSIFLSLLFTLGVSDTPILKILLFVVHTAEQSRNMPAHDGSDSFVRHLLLWSCFLPLTRVWSMQARQRSRRTSKNLFPNYTISGLPCLAIKLQIVLMYLGTVLLRLETMGWKSEWMPPQLTAVHYALSGSFAARDNFMTRLITQTPWLSRIMTAQAMLLEGLAPIFCLLGGPYRHLAAMAMFALHFGLILTVNLVNWQLVGMLVQVIWIPTHVWDRCLGVGEGTDNTTLTYKKDDGDGAPTRRKSAHDSIDAAPISRCLRTFFFAYMIYNWMGNRKWIPKHDHGDIGEGLRLSQYWVMYRTVGTTAHLPFLTGYCHDDRTGVAKQHNDTLQVVDLFHYVKTGNWKIQDPLELLHTGMTDHFPSARWERAITQWIQQSGKRTAIKTFGRKLCTLVNSDRQNQGLPQINEVELSWIDVELMPPGSTSRYNRKKMKRHAVSATCRLA